MHLYYMRDGNHGTTSARLLPNFIIASPMHGKLHFMANGPIGGRVQVPVVEPENLEIRSFSGQHVAHTGTWQ